MLALLFLIILLILRSRWDLDVIFPGPTMSLTGRKNNPQKGTVPSEIELLALQSVMGSTFCCFGASAIVVGSPQQVNKDRS